MKPGGDPQVAAERHRDSLMKVEHCHPLPIANITDRRADARAGERLAAAVDEPVVAIAHVPIVGSPRMSESGASEPRDELEATLERPSPQLWIDLPVPDPVHLEVRRDGHDVDARQLISEIVLWPFVCFPTHEPEQRVARVRHSPLGKRSRIARPTPPQDLGAPAILAPAEPPLALIIAGTVHADGDHQRRGPGARESGEIMLERSDIGNTGPGQRLVTTDAETKEPRRRDQQRRAVVANASDRSLQKCAARVHRTSSAGFDVEHDDSQADLIRSRLASVPCKYTFVGPSACVTVRTVVTKFVIVCFHENRPVTALRPIAWLVRNPARSVVTYCAPTRHCLSTSRVVPVAFRYS